MKVADSRDIRGRVGLEEPEGEIYGIGERALAGFARTWEAMVHDMSHLTARSGLCLLRFVMRGRKLNGPYVC